MAEPLCPSWLSFTLTNIFRRMAHDPVRILAPFLKEGDMAIDIGCGPGFFTIPMARMVGERGMVVAIDVQPEMLEKTKRKAARTGLFGRIRLHLASSRSLGLDIKADFALAFWMAHEVDDPDRLFAEILAALKPDGVLLLVEPLMHVSERRFEDIASAARNAGFTCREAEVVRLSRAAVLRPGGP